MILHTLYQGEVKPNIYFFFSFKDGLKLEEILQVLE